ncbi:MAG: 16S rRNA (uracil(1498)-N(3))-methyltransferase [Treponema sp.]|nr:16S rRNA (uracil(1498)-N(3))-methyltransferase [Treponema sp.]
MNIILLEEHELGRSLPRRDERTIHLLKVLHKKPGDDFEAGILGGKRGTGRIEKINLDGSLSFIFNGTEMPVSRSWLRMAVAFVRPIQLRRIFRDISSIGASAVDLVGTDLGEKSYRDTKMLLNGGANAALIEGAVQARDTLIPAFTVYSSLDEWLERSPWHCGDPKQSSFARAPILIAMDNVRPEGSIFNLSSSNKPLVISVGPERGWSDRERDLFEKAGFLRLSMGARALRTETACAAAAVIAMDKFEE